MGAKFSRNRLRSHWWLVAVVLLAALRLVYDQWTPRRPASMSEGVYQVRRVVDGDTLLLETEARVRLQGIDTPETVRPDYPVEPWGPEASEFTKQFVEDADGEVRLTFGVERLDDYGRFLAFVWHNDRMLNEELVREGLARARLDYRYSGTMKRRLAAAEEEARSASRGIWSTAITKAPIAD